MIYIVKKDEDSDVEQLLFCKSNKKKNYKFNSKKAKTLSTSDFFNDLKDFGNPEVIIKKIKLDNNVLEVDTLKTVSTSSFDKPLVEHIELVLDDNLLSNSIFMERIESIIKDFQERKDEIELLSQKREISFYEKHDMVNANSLFKKFIKYSSLGEADYNQMLNYYFCLQDNKVEFIKDNTKKFINIPLKTIFRFFSKLKWLAIIILTCSACFKFSTINSVFELLEFMLVPFFIIVGGCFYDINYKQIEKALTGKMDMLIEEMEKEYGFSKEMEKDRNNDLLVTYLVDDMNYARTHQKEEDLSSITSLFKKYNLQEKERVTNNHEGNITPYEDAMIRFVNLNELTFIETKLYSETDTDTIMKVMDKLVADIDKRLAFLGLHNYDNKCINLTKQIIRFLNDNPYEGYEIDILNLFYLLQSYVNAVVVNDDISNLMSEKHLFSAIREVVDKFKFLVENAKNNEGKWEKCFDLLNILYVGERPEYDNDQELKYPGIPTNQE